MEFRSSGGLDNVSRDFNKAVMEDKKFVESSLYWKQTSKYLNIFPPEKLKVLFFDDLIAKPQVVMSDIFAHLGIKNVMLEDLQARKQLLEALE